MPDRVQDPENRAVAPFIAIPTAWHALTGNEVLHALDAPPGGLSSGQVQRRRPLPAQPPRRLPKWLTELGESLIEPLQLLLLTVGVLSAVFGELRDAVAIFAVIAAVVIIETLTELRAERAVAGLRALTAPIARVRRDDQLVEVPTAALVVGDVIQVEAGDLVAADARLLRGSGLRVNEATLTGEATAVDKHPDPVAEGAALAERDSMLYAGTAVTTGDGEAVVTAVGGGTELGKLGRLAATEREPSTPLQRALRELARIVLIFAVVASILVPVVGVLAGRPVKEMLLEGLTVAFATVPEELPILITVLLAVGGQQLARRGALLRRLHAGETLGAATVVLTDKTGTLTENHLQLVELTGDRVALLTTALRTHPPRTPGTPSREPLEAELAAAADRAGVQISDEPVESYPFDPASKLISRVWGTPTGFEIAASGAPEAVLNRCRLTDAQRHQAEHHLTDLTGRGYRVIAFAHRTDSTQPADRDDAERDLSFLGLAAFEDPLRPGVGEAVAALHAASVQTIVVTGDHPTTAAALARNAGLGGGPVLLGGLSLSGLPDDQLDPQLRDGTVVARATPQDKLRLVRLLQQRGEIVAVTGDGANDAPALAAADIGIAMGRRGADLARDAADLVLTDDAYPTVVAAIAKGRNISAQLRRAVAFYLGAKLALVLTLLIPLALRQPAPFAPVHIVLLELFMDLGASVAFVAEPAAPQAMSQPPRPPGAKFLDRPELTAILTVAATLSLAVAPVYLITLHLDGPDPARAAAVLAWLAAHALIAWTLRTNPALPLPSNLAFPLWAATATAVGLTLALTNLGQAIHLAPIPPRELAGVVLFVAVSVIVAVVSNRVLKLARRL